MNNIPRPEYPRPQFVRDCWQNLNGEWDFYIDYSKSGEERKIYEYDGFDGKINVPFCPESKLSGVENKDFMECVWYKRKISHPFSPDVKPNDRIILHVGACDYHSLVYVNSKQVGSHTGGFVPFAFDITDYLTDGENDLTICAYDNTRCGYQPCGKQSSKYYSHACDYTRTTGIWQTVWLEAVNATRIDFTKYITDINSSTLSIYAKCINAHNCDLVAKVYFEGECITEGTAKVCGDNARLIIHIENAKLWDITSPNLYDLELYIKDVEETKDFVKSYFGMRSVAYDDKGHRFYLNNRSVFMRLILDQGFYPDGIYTAPNDDELINDIKRSMAMGFNGARLHQKIFEPRFLYYCDKLGYMVWDEHPNWGCNAADIRAWKSYFAEWGDVIRRDFNCPALIGWCPLNETSQKQDNELIKYVYEWTKTADETRPVIDTSGYFHVETDILDCHDYDQNAESVYKKYHEKLCDPNNDDTSLTTVDGHLPVRISFVSEYGGIWWQPNSPDVGWGYGGRPKSEEEFIERYRGLTLALLSCEALCGFCYTQLTDIEQEVNGLYYYNRVPKFKPEILYEITTTPAACEK